MKCSEQYLECNNCSRNVCIFISIHMWLSFQNCCMLHVIYPLISSLHWQLLCNRWRNKGNVLGLLINNLRGSESSGRVQPAIPVFFCRLLSLPFHSSEFCWAWPSSGQRESFQHSKNYIQPVYSYSVKLKIPFAITVQPKLFSLSRPSVIRSSLLRKPRVVWCKMVTDDPQSYTQC